MHGANNDWLFFEGYASGLKVTGRNEIFSDGCGPFDLKGVTISVRVLVQGLVTAWAEMTAFTLFALLHIGGRSAAEEATTANAILWWWCDHSHLSQLLQYVVGLGLQLLSCQNFSTRAKSWRISTPRPRRKAFPKFLPNSSIYVQCMCVCVYFT